LSWRYRLGLEADAVASDERVDLVFDGLDTVATIKLNGVAVGSTANMHRGYRFDVRPMITSGANQLTVDFRSALEYAEDVERALGKRAHTNTHPYNMVRKMACSFGWDWGPDFQTAGLWKPVRLERWRTARLGQVRPLVTVDEDGTGRVEVHVDVERSGLGDDVDLMVAVDVAGHRASVTVPPGATRGVVVATVPQVDLWWPAGYGAQPLHDLEVALVSGQLGQNTSLDSYVRRIGFRTISVDTTPTRSARLSPSWSTAGPSSSRARTGSRTTTS
jgi:beta-mannosidase